MVAFVTTMPSGIPGAVSRIERAVIESQTLNAALPFASYGIPYKLAAGCVVPVAAADPATVVAGFIVRAFPVQNAIAAEGLGVNTPITTGVGNAMRSGYMTVHCNLGVPALGGAVYVRIAAAGAGKPIGGVEAGADAGNCVLIPGAMFMSAADAAGNVEISYNI